MSDFGGVFEVLAADDTDTRLASRRALVLSESRINERLGTFLGASKDTDEFDARLSYVEDDFKGIITVACEEVGHGKPEAIFSSLRAHYRPVETRVASTVHEARKPKMCPYHSEVVDISLGAADPKAGYEVMQSHAWGGNHCQGDWEGKCNFKREMVTQSYWDDRQKTLDEQREQRQQEAPSIDPVPQGVDDTPEVTEPIGETENAPEGDNNLIEFPSPEGPIDNGGSPVDAGESLAVAASVKEGKSRTADAAPSQESFRHLTNDGDNPSDQKDSADKKVPCPECGGDGKTNGGKECPRCKGHGRVQDWGPSTLDALDSSIHASITAGDKKWIQKAVKKPGDLHKKLHVPDDENIPDSKIEKAEESGSENLKEKAQFAENMKELGKGKSSAEVSEEARLDKENPAPDPQEACPGCGKFAHFGQPIKHAPDCPEVKKESAVRVSEKGNTDLGGPEPKIDKRKWTPQNVRKIEVPSERHPTKEKDPIEPIKAVNDDDLVEIGEKTTERVELPAAGVNLDDSGFADKNQEQAPGTKTWTGTDGQADPVTTQTTSKADDVERNPVRDLLTEGFDGFVAPSVISRVTGR